MADLPTPIAEMEMREFASYPRPNPPLPLADRLEALVKAYYGLTVPFLVTFAFAAVVVALGEPTRYADHVNYKVLTYAFCSIPFLAAALSFLPMTRLAYGSGWRLWTAAGLSAAIALYIIVAAYLFPIFTDEPPDEDFLQMIRMVLLAMTAFPLVRLLSVWQIRRLGIRTGPWLSRKKMDAEIKHLRDESESMNPPFWSAVL